MSAKRIVTMNVIQLLQLIQIVLYKCSYYMEENFIEIKTENVDIALCYRAGLHAKVNALSNVDIDKIFS